MEKIHRDDDVDASILNGKTIAVIKQVPAEVCYSCGEPFLQA